MLVAVEGIVHVLSSPVLDEVLHAEVLALYVEVVALVGQFPIQDGPQIVFVLHSVIGQQTLQESICRLATQLVGIVLMGELFADLVYLNVLIEELDTLVNVLLNDIINIQLVLLIFILERPIEYYLNDIRDILGLEIQICDLDIVLLYCFGLPLLQWTRVDWLQLVVLINNWKAPILIFARLLPKVIKISLIIVVIK